ncbi:hypothetical protein MesoLj113b_73810 (plasmid) [Mesorhizobium sp. 113-3-3]|nr:hypothetical protein MesoLj113b_73810 [Mesorhizobium sp. 113-3-3]
MNFLSPTITGNPIASAAAPVDPAAPVYAAALRVLPNLLEDAQRDWAALGMERLLVTPLSRFAQGRTITLPEGILFTTYATLRSDDRGEKVSRVRQIVQWLGSDFDGVLIVDEAHAMQNAGGGKGEGGDVAPSQQGRAGLGLQHALPGARVVHVSATGATTVANLAYAQRLGLWGGDDFPFSTRAEFVEAIEAGGVAAMEVLARDLRALGPYTARSLSFDGVEYELVEHELTPEQRRIYGAFAVIHNHLDAAMQAANITGDSGTLNRQAKSAARSAFQSAKQRFFGHLLTSMKTPTLTRSIEQDLQSGHSTVIQIVSTGEALMERRPTQEWNDVRVDITPREYVLDYLEHSFPVQLYEPFTDSEGNLSSRPVFRDGQPVESREAVARRTALIEKLASLPPVPGALDQIVQRFGTDMVAEVTGRSRRIVRKGERLMVEGRATSANLAETQAFMDDVKRILVFSDAGGTGRSYHAELSAPNTHLRVAGLLLPIWKRLPNESSRVYRLQTDDGERIIGRRVSAARAAGALATGVSTLTAQDAFNGLAGGRTMLDLPEGLHLRRVRVMGANRIELSGFTDTMRVRLTAYGLFHEIISWKLRMFVPTDASGPAVLAKIIERHPIQRISEREAS